ncbi:MAG: hypothetical protein SGPRY_008124, partial [Prymnesium sp.]
MRSSHLAHAPYLRYIASLIPCLLLFPFFVPITRFCSTPRRSWLLWLLLLSLCAASYLPVHLILNQPHIPLHPSNSLFTFPPAQFADFFAGATAAALAKRHRPLLRRFLAPSSTSASLFPDVVHHWWRRALTSLLSDACIVAMGFVIFQPVYQGDIAHDQHNRSVPEMIRSDASIYHAATIPIALYLYLSVASGGLGLFAALCRHPALVSLGPYSLYAFLFQ